MFRNPLDILEAWLWAEVWPHPCCKNNVADVLVEKPFRDGIITTQCVIEGHSVYEILLK